MVTIEEVLAVVDSVLPELREGIDISFPWQQQVLVVGGFRLMRAGDVVRDKDVLELLPVMDGG